MKTLPYKKGQGYLITDRLTRKYLSGVDIAEGYILYAEKPLYFTDARYFYAAKEKLSGTGFIPVLNSGIDDVKSAINDLSVKELFVDYSRTTVKEYEQYKSFAEKISDCSNVLENAREVKNAEEIRAIEKACKIAQDALEFAFENVREGMTERELCAILENKMAELGSSGPSFDTIVAFGANAAVPHHETGDTKLEKNSVILIDTGCVSESYLSDVTRTAFFGEPDEEFAFCYQAVLEANEKAEREIVEGTDTFSADKIARDVLEEKGLGKYFTHSLGHGVGMEIHETPYLSPKKKGVKIRNGVVFTVEPGVYKDGRFGIRIEDTCVMENGKTRRLFTDDKKLKIIKTK